MRWGCSEMGAYSKTMPFHVGTKNNNAMVLLKETDDTLYTFGFWGTLVLDKATCHPETKNES